MTHFKPEADVGDIIKISGYGDDLFEIISVNYTYFKDTEVEFDFYEYETLGLSDKRNYFAEGNEITVVERKKKSKINKVKVTNKNERIDELLTELSDVMMLIEMFGEHEDDKKKDRKYEIRKSDIKAELNDITGGMRR